jgi:hypothetical protein
MGKIVGPAFFPQNLGINRQHPADFGTHYLSAMPEKTLRFSGKKRTSPAGVSAKNNLTD